jgi:2-(1,2-epoxy-1,2-dihydrophenyl)acetyl-CoA isomerase
MAVSAAPVLLVQEAGPVTTLTLNRPAQLNALDLPLALELLQAVEHIAQSSTARVVVLRGAGAAFCGGGDVAAMHAHRDDLPGFVSRVIDTFHATTLGLRRLKVPVLACVHGAAAGGGFSLAMACDLVLAARSSRFVVAYPKLGASSDGGLSFQLTQRLGAVRGFEALTVRGSFDAERAMECGLINRVVDDDALEAELAQFTTQLLSLPQQAVTELKGLVKAQSDAAFEAHLAREKEAFVRCAATADFAARVAAFVQKS